MYRLQIPYAYGQSVGNVLQLISVHCSISCNNFCCCIFRAMQFLSYIGGPNSSSFASVFAEIVRDPLV